MKHKAVSPEQWQMLADIRIRYWRLDGLTEKQIDKKLKKYKLKRIYEGAEHDWS